MVDETYLLDTWDASEADREAKRQHLRREIDAAYLRGFDDGRDSISALPVLLTGAVMGTLGLLAWLALV